ncbi:4951_t:CDS:2, partial [Dentiscutata erythropus]
RQEVYPFQFLSSQQDSNTDDTIITNSINEVQFTSTPLMHSNTDNEVQLMSTQTMHSNAEYKPVLLDALKIVQEQENANNIQWAWSVQGSFKGIQSLVTDIQSYRRRLTNPCTWKDHNQHTMFLNY